MPGYGFSEHIIELSKIVIGRQHVRRAAPTQGGVIAGDNPTEFSDHDPLRLWVIQVAFVIITTQILSIALRKMRQPRVISEVLSGVVLGPTLLGRIPKFSDTIFPAESIPFLTLTANIGLVLFLFLVGLEIDTSVIKKNARNSIIVASAGMLLPFGMGAGVAAAVHKEFVDQDQVSFGHFLLFVGVAFAITAFPVLCRILTELNLLETTVGIIVLSAGVVCDIVAWVMLALAVSLVNASTGLTALWVLLATTAFTIFILFPIKWGFVRLARYTGSLEEGQPSGFMMTVTILLVFSSAFVTDILGVHPIFGGFLAGLVIPHESGFAIALVEKLEDLVTLLFLPIYFTLSGLRTDLGLLNNGITWGYTILICVVAFLGKFVGAAGAAKFLKFNNRESGAIGILMSCKGLVELIVLNIGLQAGILDTRVFSMFVLEALVLTFITTPLTLAIYPPKHRSLHDGAKLRHARPHGADEESTEKGKGPSRLPLGDGGVEEDDLAKFKSRITIPLYKIEHLPALMTITQLLERPFLHFSSITKVNSRTPTANAEGNGDQALVPSSSATPPSPSPRLRTAVSTTLDAFRLIDLTDRTSAVMMSSVTEELLARDPMLSSLRSFSRLHKVPVTSMALSVLPHEEFAPRLVERTTEVDSDFIVIPWSSNLHPILEVTTGTKAAGTPAAVQGSYNPFDAVFGASGSGAHEKDDNIQNQTHRGGTAGYAHFVRKVFALSAVDVALFVEREIDISEMKYTDGVSIIDGHHVFLPWFGGPDDRVALAFVIQLCANVGVQATVVRYTRKEDDLSRTPTGSNAPQEDVPPAYNNLNSITAFPDTVYGAQSTQFRLESDTADNIMWNRYNNKESVSQLPVEIQESLSRVNFQEVATSTPLRTALTVAESLLSPTAGSFMKKNVIAIVGRARRMAVESHREELKLILEHHPRARVSGDFRKTLGDAGLAFMVGSDVSLMVLQAAHASNDV